MVVNAPALLRNKDADAVAMNLYDVFAKVSWTSMGCYSCSSSHFPCPGREFARIVQC